MYEDHTLKTARVTVRLTPEEKAALGRIAEEDGRPLGRWIGDLLREVRRAFRLGRVGQYPVGSVWGESQALAEEFVLSALLRPDLAQDKEELSFWFDRAFKAGFDQATKYRTECDWSERGGRR